MLIRSRREFLRNGLRSVTALGALGALGKFGEMNALAAGGSGYQALVCIFLSGGNDGHSVIVPIETSAQNYSLYQSARPTLAVPQNALLPISNGPDTYGINPNMPEIQALYNSKAAAAIANVGMLVGPVSRSAYLGGAPVPSALFSHSDQASQWQTAIPSGLGNTGWGGRLIDALQSNNSAAIFPPITSTGGCGLFCSGNVNQPAVVPPGGTPQLQVSPGGSRAQGLQQLLSFNNGLQLVQAANGLLQNGINYANTLDGLIANVNIKTVFPAGNPLAAQLQTVAQVMAVRNQLGLSRQIFFCELGGFDTHGSQQPIQDPLLQQLSQAVGAFYQATQELAIDGQVVTFTASEFGRTLQPNGSAGTDHAWGSHHFIIGTGVRGGSIYGNFPLLALGGQNDANTRGTLIPTTSVDQYGATLAQWFGVTSGMSSIFPNLVNFTTTNLGFLG